MKVFEYCSFRYLEYLLQRLACVNTGTLGNRGLINSLLEIDVNGVSTCEGWDVSCSGQYFITACSIALHTRSIKYMTHCNISIPGGHDVVEVDNFDEGLDFASLLDLGFAHRSNNLSGVSINTGNYN